jgi:hypothetical protein
MTLFIGPAICEPEKHGIIADIPISVVARHNLNQVEDSSIIEKNIFHLILDCDCTSNISNVE